MSRSDGLEDCERKEARWSKTPRRVIQGIRFLSTEAGTSAGDGFSIAPASSAPSVWRRPSMLAGLMAFTPMARRPHSDEAPMIERTTITSLLVLALLSATTGARRAPQ